MEGWATRKLGDVCKVIGGGTPSKSSKSFYTGKIPWATVRDMSFEIITKTDFAITDEGIANSSTKLIPKGNVIIATRVGLGKVCILSKDTAINQDIRAIIPKNTQRLDIRFLFRWLQSQAQVIKGEGVGLTVKGVKLPFVKSLNVPLPLISEQQKIVAILDEAFEGIDAAVANAKKT